MPWAGPFTLVLGILLVRNAWLFTVPVYEDADMGAYSIQVEQARRFSLLVGNYSRERFNHPGPALLLVIVLAGTESLAARWSAPRFAAGIAVALALAGCTAFAVAPLTRLATDHTDPGNPQAPGPVSDPSLPAGVARLGALAAGRYAVLTFPHGAWPAITGILAQAERSGVAACVADPWWEFMMTSQFICTRKEILSGVRFTVWAPDGVPRGMPVLVRLRRGIVTYGPK